MKASHYMLCAAICSALGTASLPLRAADVAEPVADPGTDSVLVQHTRHDRLYSLAFHSDQGFAVGEAGLVMTSRDGGQTWEQDQAPTELALLAVATNGNRSIAVGQLGLILVKEGDEPWRAVDSGTDSRLLRVAINDSGLAVVTGAFGTLLLSADGGDTWEDIAPDWMEFYSASDEVDAIPRDEPTNYVAHVSEEGHVLIGGEYGQLMHSADQGQSWTVAYQSPVIEASVPPTIFGMEIRADGKGYAVGQSGLVLQTSDAGRNWSKLNAQSNGSLFAVTSFADGHIVAIGMRAGLVSADGGKTWAPLQQLDIALNWYSALARGGATFEDGVIAAGHSGRIVRLQH